jgi:hypothetical protein
MCIINSSCVFAGVFPVGYNVNTNIFILGHPQRPSVCRSKDRGDSVTFESKLKSSLSLDSTAQLLKEADVKTKALRNEVNDLKRKLDDKGYIIDSLQTKVTISYQTLKLRMCHILLLLCKLCSHRNTAHTVCL